MQLKHPLDHIQRPSLPWRQATDDPVLTECGYPVDQLPVPAVSREEFLRRLKEEGEYRATLSTCVTCLHTAKRWPTWQEEPRLALQREIEWERPSQFHNDRRGHRLRDELLAIEALIVRHGEEFQALVDQFARRQDWIERKTRKNPG